MIGDAIREAMSGSTGRTIGLTGHPHLPMYVTNLGDRAGLLIDVELPPGASIEDGQGFDIVEITGNVRDRVLVRPTRAGSTSPAFLGLVEFVFRETAAAGSRSSAVIALLEAVHEFRKFFARRTDRLSESEVRGFFAELELILELIDVGLTPTDALQAWSGPYRGTDFKFADLAGIEVKSTRPPGRTVQISSEHQLVTPSGGLYLFVRPLTTVAPEETTGTPFMDVVERVSAVANSSPASRSLWEAAVETMGFDESDKYYRQWRFIGADWQAFAVRDDFPRIIPESTPNGVRAVSYTLELDSLVQYREEHRTVLEEVVAAYA